MFLLHPNNVIPRSKAQETAMLTARYSPVIPTITRLRWEGYEFRASLGHILRPSKELGEGEPEIPAASIQTNLFFSVRLTKVCGTGIQRYV